MDDKRVEAVARAMMRCEAWPSLYSFKDACHLARAAIAAYEKAGEKPVCSYCYGKTTVLIFGEAVACPRCNLPAAPSPDTEA